MSTNKAVLGRLAGLGSVWAVFLLAGALCLLHFAHQKVLPPFVYGSVVAQMSGGKAADQIALHIYTPGTQTLPLCKGQLDNVVSTLRSSCPSCVVQSEVCTVKPSDRLIQSLGSDPISHPSARMPGGGVVEYRSANAELALASCMETQQQSGSRVVCTKPGLSRPLSPGKIEAWQQAGVVQTAYQAMTAFLVLPLIGLLAFAHRRAGTNPIWSQKIFLASSDALLLVLAYLALGIPSTENVAALLRYDLRQALFHLALVAVNIFCYWVYFEQYARRRPWWDEVREIFRVVAVSLLLAGAALFYANLDAGRGLTLWTWGCAFVLLPLGRIASRQLMDQFGIWKRPAYIVGTGRNALEAYLAVKAERSMGYEVKGFVAVDFEEARQNWVLEVEGAELPIIQMPKNPAELMQRFGNPEVVVALDTLSDPRAQQLLHQLTMVNQNLHIIPTIRGLPLFGAKLSHFFSHEVLFLTVRNNLSRRSYRLIKRTFDLIVASTLLVLFSPLFVWLALWVRQDGGPALYGHKRVGRGGKHFNCLKFRSMRTDSAQALAHLLANDPQARAEWEKDFKLRNDPRITKVGRFLRKSSLDEIPQLFNVLKGEMSLVGPRPIVDAELEKYGNGAGYYLSVTPGITGLWQVSGRNDTTYAERVSLDAWYAQNWSLWYDIAILFKTVRVVVKREGAY